MLTAAQVNQKNFGKVIVIHKNGKDAGGFPIRQRVVRFGRDDACFVRLRVPEISRIHAEIEIDRETGIATLADKSSNGTHLNQAPIDTPVQLKSGDIISIADRMFRFEYPPEGPCPALDEPEEEENVLPVSTSTSKGLFGKETPLKSNNVVTAVKIPDPAITRAESSSVIPVELPTKQVISSSDASAIIITDEVKNKENDAKEELCKDEGPVLKKSMASPSRRHLQLSPSTTPMKSPKKSSRLARKDVAASLLKNVLEKNAAQVVSQDNPFLVENTSEARIIVEQNTKSNVESSVDSAKGVEIEDIAMSQTASTSASHSNAANSVHKSSGGSPRKTEYPLKRLQARTVTSPTSSPKKRQRIVSSSSPKISPKVSLFATEKDNTTASQDAQVLGGEQVMPSSNVESGANKPESFASAPIDFKDDIFWSQIERFAATAKPHELESNNLAINTDEKSKSLQATSSPVGKSNTPDRMRTNEPLSSKRRVRFGPPLAPEIFRPDHPPSSPISRGTRTDVVDGSSIIKSTLRRASTVPENRSPTKKGAQLAALVLGDESADDSSDATQTNSPIESSDSLTLNERLRDEIDQDMDDLSENPDVGTSSSSSLEVVLEQGHSVPCIVESKEDNDISLQHDVSTTPAARTDNSDVSGGTPNSSLRSSDASMSPKPKSATKSSSRSARFTPPKVPETSFLGLKEMLKTPSGKDTKTNFVGVKEVLKTPKPETRDMLLTGIKETLKTPKANSNDISLMGVKEAFQTPKDKTDISLLGLKETLKTPNVSRNFNYSLVGVKETLKTPKQACQEETNLSGISSLLSTPRITRSAKKTQRTIDEAAVQDIKHVINTPKPCGLEQLVGVKETLSTPKPESRTDNFVGLKETLKTPHAHIASPVMIGIKEALKTPGKNTSSSPSFVGMKSVFRTPKAATVSPSLLGVKTIVKTPLIAKKESPRLIGIKETLKTPSAAAQPASPVLVGLKETLKTPQQSHSGVLDDDDEITDTLCETFKSPREATECEDATKTPHKHADVEAKYIGVKEMLKTPKAQPETFYLGVRETMKTPCQTGIGSNFVGVKETLKTPFVRKETYLVGVKEMMHEKAGDRLELDGHIGSLFATPKTKVSHVETKTRTRAPRSAQEVSQDDIVNEEIEKPTTRRRRGRKANIDEEEDLEQRAEEKCIEISAKETEVSVPVRSLRTRTNKHELANDNADELNNLPPSNSVQSRKRTGKGYTADKEAIHGVSSEEHAPTETTKPANEATHPSRTTELDMSASGENAPPKTRRRRGRVASNQELGTNDMTTPLSHAEAKLSQEIALSTDLPTSMLDENVPPKARRRRGRVASVEQSQSTEKQMEKKVSQTDSKVPKSGAPESNGPPKRRERKALAEASSSAIDNTVPSADTIPHGHDLRHHPSRLHQDEENIEPVEPISRKRRHRNQASEAEVMAEIQHQDETHQPLKKRGKKGKASIERAVPDEVSEPVPVTRRSNRRR